MKLEVQSEWTELAEYLGSRISDMTRFFQARGFSPEESKEFADAFVNKIAEIAYESN